MARSIGSSDFPAIVISKVALVVISALLVVSTVGCSSTEQSQSPVDPAIYRDKVQELVDEFGAPSIETEGMRSYIAGVAFARLVDFGAGDYLLICYRDSDAAQGSLYSDTFGYKLEVWAPDGDEGEIRCAFSDDPRLDVSVSYVDGRNYLLEGYYEGESNEVYVDAVYGLADDGALQLDKEMKSYYTIPDDASSATGMTIVRNEINGEEASNEAVIDARREMLAQNESVVFTSYASGSSNLEAAVAKAVEGIEGLGAVLAGDAESSSADEVRESDIPEDKQQVELQVPESGKPYSGWLYTVLSEDPWAAVDGGTPKAHVTRSSDASWIFDGSVWCSASMDGLHQGGSRVACDLSGLAFTVSDDVLFLGIGGTSGPREIPKKQFETLVDENVQIGFEVEVEDGVIVTAILHS